MRFKFKKSSILMFLFLFPLISCGNNSNNNNYIKDTILKDDLTKLKASKRYKLDIDFNLITGKDSKEYQETYIYLENDLLYSYKINETISTIGFTSSDEGIYSYSIIDNKIVPDAILNYDISNIYDESTGLKNYYNSISLKTISFKKTIYNFKLNDLANINAFLKASSLTPTTGLTNLITEFNVIDDNNTLTFNMNFGVNGYIKHTISQINDSNLSIPLINEYKNNGGKAKQALPELKALISNLDSFNYSSDLGKVTYNNKTIKVGRKYFTSTYIYDDYTDEFINYYKEVNNKELVRGGYLSFNSNKNGIKKGVYSFTPKYDEKTNNPYLDSTCLSKQTDNIDLTTVYPYFSRLLFYKYISSFDKASSSNNLYMTTRQNIAYDFGKNILGIKSKIPDAMFILNNSKDGDINFDFLIKYDQDVYTINASMFNQTKIDFIENYIK